MVLQPNRYEAQAVASLRSWRKNMLAKLSRVRLNSKGMTPRHHKNALFEAIAVMGKAFASPRRLELIDLLAQGPRSVEELSRASGPARVSTTRSQATTSCASGSTYATPRRGAWRKWNAPRATT